MCAIPRSLIVKSTASSDRGERASMRVEHLESLRERASRAGAARRRPGWPASARSARARVEVEGRARRGGRVRASPAAAARPLAGRLTSPSSANGRRPGRARRPPPAARARRGTSRGRCGTRASTSPGAGRSRRSRRPRPSSGANGVASTSTRPAVHSVVDPRAVDAEVDVDLAQVAARGRSSAGWRPSSCGRRPSSRAGTARSRRAAAAGASRRRRDSHRCRGHG